MTSGEGELINPGRVAVLAGLFQHLFAADRGLQGRHTATHSKASLLEWEKVCLPMTREVARTSVVSGSVSNIPPHFPPLYSNHVPPSWPVDFPMSMFGHQGWCDCPDCPQAVQNAQVWGRNYIWMPKYQRDDHWHHVCDWCDLWGKYARDFVRLSLPPVARGCGD